MKPRVNGDGKVHSTIIKTRITSSFPSPYLFCLHTLGNLNHSSCWVAYLTMVSDICVLFFYERETRCQTWIYSLQLSCAPWTSPCWSVASVSQRDYIYGGQDSFKFYHDLEYVVSSTNQFITQPVAANCSGTFNLAKRLESHLALIPEQQHMVSPNTSRQRRCDFHGTVLMTF